MYIQIKKLKCWHYAGIVVVMSACAPHLGGNVFDPAEMILLTVLMSPKDSPVQSALTSS